MFKPKSWRALAPIVTLLLVALSGCASAPRSLPQPAEQVPQIPPLAPQARQPQRPEICLPTCSAGLMRLREQLLLMPTKPLQPVPPAKAPMTP